MAESAVNSSPGAGSISALCATAATWQEHHPWRFVAVGVILALASVPLIAQLELRGSFYALLPDSDSAPSVRAAEEFSERFGVASTLTIAVLGDDITPVRGLTAALAQSLERNPPDGCRVVDWNLSAVQRFVDANKALFVSYNDFVIVRDLVLEQIEYHTALANPLVVDIAGPPPDPVEYLDDLRQRSNKYTAVLENFPDGYFQHPTDPLTLIFVRTDIGADETARAVALVAEIERRVAELRTAVRGADDSLRVSFGGDLFGAILEGEALRWKVAVATVVTTLLVLFAVFLFFSSRRAAGLLGLSLVVPVSITFGLAALVVDGLNMATAFLGCVIVGSGINPGVIWLARYFELRRAGVALRDALVVSHRRTGRATLLAAGAAALAYGSLIVTDFRGLREFGIIGGVGMALCWLAAHALLPALAVLFERVPPQVSVAAGASEGQSYRLGATVARLALYSPRSTALATAAATGAAVAVIAMWVHTDPMEYDYRALHSRAGGSYDATWVDRWQREIVPMASNDAALAVLVPSRAHAISVREQLERRRLDFPDAYSEVHNLDQLRPEKQEAKLSLLRDIRRQVQKLQPRMKADDWQELLAHLPPDGLSPIGYADLPPEALRVFTEKEGALGRVVYVEPRDGADTSDGRYLLRWAAAVRSVVLPDGTVPMVAGTAPLFADLYGATLVDGAKTMFVATASIGLLLLLGLGRWRDRLLCMATLLVGLLWMVAVAAFGGMQLSFLNFIAFPLALGHGVGFGVNILQRTEAAKSGDRRDAVRCTLEAIGGPVILCALTTAIGYGGLLVSGNAALSWLGAAMVIGVVTSMAAAVLAMPAVATLISQRTAAEEAP